MSKATMVAVIALATLHGDGRKKIAGSGDQIMLPEADADRLKALGLVKFAEKPASKTSKPTGGKKASAGTDDGANAGGNGGDGTGTNGTGAGNGGDGTGGVGTGAGNA